MNLDQLPNRHSLASKLLLLSLVWLVAAMVSIGYTLVLSWKLQGGAAAINDAGSLRMHTYHAMELLSQNQPPAVVEAEKQEFTNTLDRLIAGDPSRPLFLPDQPQVRAQAELVRQQWHTHMLPLLTAASAQRLGNAALDTEGDRFVGRIDQLVRLVEIDNASNTALLRIFQLTLIGMAVVGSISMIYLLYLMVILPVDLLHQGMQRLSQGDLGSRVDIESRDEFGALASGFNQMASRLQGLVQDMERKVRDKTHALESNNRQLGALYAVTTFLHQSHNLEDICAGFLRHVMALVQADGGSVRLLDEARGKIDEVAEIGLPEELQHQDVCARVDGCFCGQAANQTDAVVHFFSAEDLRRAAASDPGPSPGELLPAMLPIVQGGAAAGEAGPAVRPCETAGFHGISVFQIRSGQHNIGVFTLFFRTPRTLDTDERHLLEVLGSHLGVAIDNTRLAARDRQLAVMEERNLMAQGLHDSIAQSLSFLNLQVQMLDTALRDGELAQAQENLAFIRAGVQESYEDVRELLLNFRVRINRQELPEAIRTLLARFEQQTHVATHLDLTGTGLPLDPQQQLQVIFILQEALSNVRKHAQASHVDVHVRNEADFTLTVTDNGRGIDYAQMQERKARHVGLSIMQERASRIHATVHITPAPQGGTRVELVLPQQQRIAT